ncbi:hypothetical protein D3C72_1815540 [compost metagenome]
MDAVVRCRRDPLEPGIAGPAAALRQHDLSALAPARHQLWYQRGRVLQVDVDRNDGIAHRLVKACRQGRFLAEVPRQVNHAHAFVATRIREQLLERIV